MKNTIAKLIIVLAVTILSVSLTFAQTTDEFLITKDSVGRLKLGMTIKQARKVLANHHFERTNDKEDFSWAYVKRGDEVLMKLRLMEAGRKKKSSPLQDDAVIDLIEVFSPIFYTAQGIRPQMLLKNAEMIHKRVVNISEAGDGYTYASFAEESSRLYYVVENKALDGEDEVTTNPQTYKLIEYHPTTYIWRISIVMADSRACSQ